MSQRRYRWVVLGAGTLAQASFSASSVGLPALGPQLKTGYGLTLGQTGVVLAAIGIGMLFTLLPWGLVADRFDERWVIASGLTCAAAGLAGASATHSFGAVTGVLVAVGALGASVNAASGRAIMAWFPSSELGLALGIRQTAIPIGGALGGAVLPALGSAGGTRAAFLFLAGACATGALVAAVFIRSRAGASELELGEISRPLHDPHMWLLGLGTGLFLVAQIGITGFVVLFLHEQRHLSEYGAAAVFLAINLLAIGARIASGRISDRIGSRLRPLRMIGVVLAVFTAAVAAGTDAPLALLIPLFVVAGVLSMAWNGLAYAAAAEAVGAARTGAALGFQQTLLGVVVAAAPPAVAAVAEHSWRLAFLLAAAGPALGVVILRKLREPASGRRRARTPGTSASRPAAPRTPD